MKRRSFLASLGVMLAAPLGAETQSPSPRSDRTLPVVGYLGNGHPSDRRSPHFAYLFEAFTEGLREVGYVDGETVTIEWRFAEERYERLAELAAELVRLGVNVIYAPSDHSTVAVSQATTRIPIVFSAAGDPVASGFALSLSRPGRNMTGITQPSPEITGKRLSFLKEAVTNLSRVAILRNPAQTSDLRHLPIAKDSARTLRLASEVFEARGLQDFEGVFSAMVKSRAQAVLLLPDTAFYIRRDELAALALRHRLPMMAFRGEFGRAGALMAYGGLLSAAWRRAGVLAGKILNGSKPEEMPIEQPRNFELVINVKTAKALGLAIPPLLLLRADEVIE
jgi:putative ABC transport system substrate-binding protein